jgi:2-succinyl-5-enolpyruvyl-6-hydroxy-3-cyclohexene-1-carboxylate synthase
MLQPSEREKVAELLLCWKCPTYFEAPSGLREDARFRDFRVRVSHRIRQRAVQSDYPIDGVIRIGGVPTLRFWRDLDLDDAELPVLNMSEIPFSGLGRPSIQLSLSHFCRFDFCEHYKEDFPKNFFEQDRKAQAELERLLECEPQSEPGMVAKLSCLIPQRAQIFLGNSLPIREWDLAATSQDRGYQIWASRGLNGIDGQISTFLGLAEPGLSHWAILGDLTTLYDLSGPWILSQWGGGVPSKLDVNLVVINNGGGKIFSQMFSQSEFQNPHSLCFKSWANFWGLEYELWHQIPTSSEKTGERPRVIELRPDEKATQRFWKEASRE